MKHEQSINGQRFTALRRIFTLTQHGLAERLDVGQSFLSQIERGLRPVPAPVAHRAAESFELPLSFFTVVNTPLDTGPATFRKNSRAKHRDDDRYGELYNEASRFFRFVSQESGYPQAKLPDPADFGHDPEQIAKLLREAIGLGPSDPVPNATRALERLGFGVIDQLDEGQADGDHSGITRPSPLMQHPLVALTKNSPGAVKRLTLLHEAYHHIADRNLPTPITSSRSPEETRAFRFAGAFLLPDTVVHERITESLPLHGFLPIKADYGISASAIIRRAKDLEVISPSRSKSLYIQWSSAGWRKDEPVDVPDERPMLIEQAMRHVFGHHPIHQCSEVVGTSPVWIRRWCGLGPDRLADSGRAEVVSLEAARRRRRA
ncbi:helix-turn-helix domain-containing protein [Nesterenkonia ebinurensis]|uniref:helix-turn-helix domain-containing protein n=1 Tax=Nesterenkonia ebinurensis TaxID=2608252 RepID=UPI00168AAC72|nr:XRE family transcriptional regulator [Nesterenkonia ebinurensis]